VRPLVDELRERLGELAAQGLHRELRAPAGIDFCSNDYLGLAGDPGLRAALLDRLRSLDPGEALSAPASRLLRGHVAEHAALERRLARYKGTEAALLFPSGYQANLGLLATLIGPADRAVSDAANHASLIDGLRLAGCRKVVFPHLDGEAVERELARPHPAGRTFLVTESLFSMDGDVAPLGLYAGLASRYGAELIVDDAHATGLFGEERGSGLGERFGIAGQATAIVSTCGKALGVAGAFVAGPRVVIDTLVHRCRPFLFTTAVPPLLAHAIGAALDLAEAEPWRRRLVLALADRLRDRLRAAGFDGPLGVGPIVPVLLGENHRTIAVAEELQRQGFDVRMVRPPTVPPGTARLRISVHADRSEAEIDALAEALAAAVIAPRPRRLCEAAP